jgi:hypothetical protein
MFGYLFVQALFCRIFVQRVDEIGAEKKAPPQSSLKLTFPSLLLLLVNASKYSPALQKQETFGFPKVDPEVPKSRVDTLIVSLSEPVWMGTRLRHHADRLPLHPAHTKQEGVCVFVESTRQTS